MKKIFFVLAFLIALSSCAFANEEEARDAMIIYSGTESFARLLPEERQACMIWVSEGGAMSETCKTAVRTLIAENPNAVTTSQRRALLMVVAGYSSRAKTESQPIPESKTEIQKDNTGALIAAGVAAVVLGMVIHNNIGRSSSRHGPPPPPPMYRPAPPPHGRPPMRR